MAVPSKSPSNSTKRADKPSKPPKSPAISPKTKKSKAKKAEESPSVSESDADAEEAAPSEKDEDSDDSEGDDVDEEGMERLMKALGEDALDEFEQAQLRALGGAGEEDDSEDDEGEDVDAGSNEEEEKGGAGGDEPENGDEVDEDETEEEGIPLDDLVEADQDAVPRQKKAEIDDTLAMQRIRDTIKLDPTFQWTETLVLSYPGTIDVDVNDDLNRELAFYKQALHSVNEARTLAAKHHLPFTRPSDYFAEMVKSDAHMERIRQRLLNETAGIKKSEDKRKEREGKKFGKQVQVEKLKEREKSKKEMEERLKGLKRKRKDVLDRAQGDGDDDAFDIAVEDAITDRPAKRAKGEKPGGKKVLPRQARDKKFGFGGAGRRSKQNTRESTDAFVNSRKDPKGGKGGRHGSKRLGKSRRVAQKSRG